MSGDLKRARAEAAMRFIGERVLIQRCLYLIRQVNRDQSGAVRGYSYVTFDDPTGGAPDRRVDIAAGESPGPVRTLLAFTDEELAAEYHQEELKGVGEPCRFIINSQDMGRMFRFLMGGRIQWIMFDRVPGSHRSEARYTCWLIPVLFLAKMVNKYVDSVGQHIEKMPSWTPSDDMVVEVPEDVQKMIDDTRND